MLPDSMAPRLDLETQHTFSSMTETPLTPLDPFADSPEESLSSSSSSLAAARTIMARVFAFPSPPPPVVPLFAIQVHLQYHNDTAGSLYTSGLHAHGFPELVAQGVPRSRASFVVKNMHFLAGRMLQGIAVQPGHRSTDHDYRVAIVAAGPSSSSSSSPPHHTLLKLMPFYHDCEEWGSFPPAPNGDRIRRNRLLAAAWFSTPGDTISFDAADAAYFVRHVEHFARLFQVVVAELPRIMAAFPRDLQGLIYGHTTTMYSCSSRGPPPPTSVRTAPMTSPTRHFFYTPPSPGGVKRTASLIPLQSRKTNIPKKKQSPPLQEEDDTTKKEQDIIQLGNKNGIIDLFGRDLSSPVSRLKKNKQNKNNKENLESNISNDDDQEGTPALLSPFQLRRTDEEAITPTTSNKKSGLSIM